MTLNSRPLAACLKSWTLAVSALLSSITFAGGVASGSSPALQPLDEAGVAAADFRYSLPKLDGCEVGDAINVFVDRSSKRIIIRNIVLQVPHSVETSTQYKLLSFEAGSTTGEVAPSFNLSGLRNSTSLGSAIGATIEPLSSGKRWYVIAADLRVHSDVPKHWVIRGMTVTTSFNGESYKITYPSSIVLPPTSGCH
jgi:hypothetical protein